MSVLTDNLKKEINKSESATSSGISKEDLEKEVKNIDSGINISIGSKGTNIQILGENVELKSKGKMVQPEQPINFDYSNIGKMSSNNVTPISILKSMEDSGMLNFQIGDNKETKNAVTHLVNSINKVKSVLSYFDNKNESLKKINFFDDR